MSNIIFITSKYLPAPDANGICVQHIIERLKSEGHQIICISTLEDGQLKKEVYEGIKIIRIKKSFFARMLEKDFDKAKKSTVLTLLLRRIYLLTILPIFPNTEPYRSRKIYKIVELLVRKKAIDCVIGVFRPFEGVAVARRIKRKYPDIICGGYYLDILRSANIPNIIPNKIYSKLCDYKELLIFKDLDFILMAESANKIYETHYFKKVEKKINYINFPLFLDIGKESHQAIDYNKEYFNIVYAGYLEKNYRNPTFIFNVIENLCKIGHKIKLHIYGRNNCIDIINRYCDNNPNNFYYYGTVDRDKAKGAILSADAVLNISNKTENVPSKVFELCSSCKPIINVVNNPFDVSLKYFKHYPSVCFIDEYKGSIESEVKNLIEFLEGCKDCAINYEEIEPIYYNSTPIATTIIINKILQNRSISKLEY